MRAATSAFALTLLLTLVPYEIVVRRSERIFGLRRANIVTAHTGSSPKIVSFFSQLAAGQRFDTLLVGSSQVEFGFRPDVLAPITGTTYNLGMQAVSSIAELEMIARLDLRPRRIIIGIAPIDLTRIAVTRGTRNIMEATTPAEVSKTGMGATQLDHLSRAATYALVHGANPERKRNLSQWVELFRGGGQILNFLNNEDATGSSRDLWINGYIGVARSIRQSDMGTAALGYANEYAADSASLLPRFAIVIRRLRAEGIDVVIVRAPTTRALRDWLARELTFDEDVQSLARTTGVDFVDGFALVDSLFIDDLSNFFDAEHLNERGSTLFSRALAAALMRRDSGKTASPVSAAYR